MFLGPLINLLCWLHIPCLQSFVSRWTHAPVVTVAKDKKIEAPPPTPMRIPCPGTYMALGCSSRFALTWFELITVPLEAVGCVGKYFSSSPYCLVPLYSHLLHQTMALYIKCKLSGTAERKLNLARTSRQAYTEAQIWRTSFMGSYKLSSDWQEALEIISKERCWTSYSLCGSLFVQ